MATTSTINTNNMSVNTQGQVKFSGLSSGIDSQGAIDGIIKAQQTRIDSVAKKIDQNTAKLKALEDLKTKSTAVTNSLSTLYGRMTADSAFDVFAAKEVSATSSRNASATGAASAPTDLIGATVTNAAVPGTYSVEVLNIAKPMKVKSSAVDDSSVALNLSGTIQIGGTNQQTTYSASSFGSAAWGTTGASLSITPSGTTTPITYTFAGTNGASAAANLAAMASAFNASTEGASSGFTASIVNGALQLTAATASDTQATIAMVTATTTLRAVSSVAGVSPGSLTVDPAQSLQDIRNAINNLSQTAPGTGVTASTISVGPTQNYMILTSSQPGGSITFTWPPGTPSSLQTSGIFSTTGDSVLQAAQQLHIKLDGTDVYRNSNQVSDLVPGVEMSFVKAEAGTTVQLNVAQSQGGIAAQINAFVTAYNDLQDFVAAQTKFDTTTGALDAGAILARSSSLRGVADLLRNSIGASTYGQAVSKSPTSLTDIGITTDTDKTSPTFGHLISDPAKLLSALATHGDDVRKMFSFTAQAASGAAQVIGFDVNTTRPDTGPFVFSFQANDQGNLTPSFLENGLPQTIERAGNTFTVSSGSAKGLTLYANATAPVAATEIVLKAGLASSVTSALNDLITADTSTLSAEKTALTDSSKTVQDRVAAMSDRLARQRDALAEKFSRMESAMSRMNTLRQQIASAFQTSSSDSN
jgi:flagellar hook-associated protein 2